MINDLKKNANRNIWVSAKKISVSVTANPFFSFLVAIAFVSRDQKSWRHMNHCCNNPHSCHASNPNVDQTKVDP